MSDIALVNMVMGGGWRGIPVGPLQIVSALETDGFSVDFYNYQNYNEQCKTDPETCLKFFRSFSSDILGCSVLCSSLPTTLIALKKLKEEKPDKLVILGGPSATDTPSEILENFPVDIIVIGEGELTIVDLMKALDGEKDLREVPGIAYRENGRIIINPRRERIKDLDSLPFPAHHKIDFEDYGSEGIVTTMRGCPYRCTFCSAHSIWQHEVTYRSIKNVIAEILLMGDQVNKLTFADDTLVLRKKRLFELCESMRKEKIDLEWRCTGRVDYISVDLLEKLASHNCTRLYLGIESGSGKILKKVGKNFSPAESRKAVDTASRYLQVITSYIWGFPFETMEDFYDTMLQLAQDMRNPHIEPMLTFLSPLPQAPITGEYHDKLRFSEKVRSGMAALPRDDYVTRYPSLIDMIKRYPDIFTVFYYFEQPEYQRKKETIDKIVRKETKALNRDSGIEVDV